jgi:hypothetical protein
MQAARPERRHDGKTAMGLLDNVGGFLKPAGDGIASAAENTSKTASDAWNTAVEDANSGANAVATVVRDPDAKKEQIGAWIDSKEQQLEHEVDEGRAWLRENGGVAGQVASAQIGLGRGRDIRLRRRRSRMSPDSEWNALAPK